MSVDGLYGYLGERLNPDVVRRETIEAFREAMVDGETFLEMTEEDVRELEPTIKLGERKAIKRLIDSYCPQQPKPLVPLVC